jgi:hypothetical protein
VRGVPLPINVHSFLSMTFQTLDLLAGGLTFYFGVVPLELP